MLTVGNKHLKASRELPPTSPLKRAAYLSILLFLLGGLGWVTWTTLLVVPQQEAAIAESDLLTATAEPIRPVPPPADLNPDKVALGQRLFHDPRLSGDNSVSCADCHNLSEGGADSSPLSEGARGGISATNAPTVFNSSFNFRQTWNGRAESLEQQIDGPVNDPQEMGSSWSEVIAKLESTPNYVSAFDDLYDNGIQIENIKDAIATFERTLLTPNSRFDRYLKGDTSVLTADEAEGYQLFKSYGCASCHQGANVGGNTFARLGVMRDYFPNPRAIDSADLGRFNVTGREEDKHLFKVPGLRMAALTAPYFHDGSVKTLEQAVDIMGRYQLGIEIPARDSALIVKFLRTLPGEYEDATR